MNDRVAVCCHDIMQLTQTIGHLLQGIRDPDPLAMFEVLSEAISQRQVLLEKLLSDDETDLQDPKIHGLASNIREQDRQTLALLRERMAEVAIERKRLQKVNTVRQAYTLN